MRTILKLFLTCVASAIVYHRNPSKDGMNCLTNDISFMVTVWSPILCCTVCQSIQNCTVVVFNEKWNVCVGCTSNSGIIASRIAGSKYYSTSEPTTEIATQKQSDERSLESEFNVTESTTTTTSLIRSDLTRSSAMTSSDIGTSENVLITSPKTAEQTTSLPEEQTSFHNVEITSVAVAENGWYSYELGFYRLFNIKLIRNLAFDYCKLNSGMNGYLVVIDDSDKNNFVKFIAFNDSTDHNTIHIGVRLDGNRTFAYYFDSPIDYNNFLDKDSLAKTDGDCIYMIRSGEWVTRKCTNDDAFPFVCETRVNPQ